MVAQSAGCLFCGQSPLRGTYVLANDERQRGTSAHAGPRPLCWKHYTILDKAGTKGRLYKPTGVRWWLIGTFPPPPGDAAAPLYEQPDSAR